MKMDLNRPTLAVIIDCALIVKVNGSIHPNIETTWKRIADVCYTNPNIKTIAVATYFDQDNDISLDEPWFGHAQNMFVDTARWQYLKQDWRQFNFQTPPYQNPMSLPTDPIIKNMQVRQDQLQLNILNTLQLTYYCNYVNTSIENILLMGCCWDQCLKNRPVGWKEIGVATQCNMFNKPKNILTRQDCVLTVEAEYPDIESPWVPVDETFYRLDLNVQKI